MKPTLLSWMLFFLWALWIVGLQGFWATSGAGSWTPELGLVLLFGLDPKLGRGERRMAVCLLAAARVAFSNEPILAVFAAYLGVSALIEGLRRSIEVDRFLVRLVLAAAASAACSSFWIFCRRIALFEDGIAAPAIELPLGGVLITALLAVFALPIVRGLPGTRAILGART